MNPSIGAISKWKYLLYGRIPYRIVEQENLLGPCLIIVDVKTIRNPLIQSVDIKSTIKNNFNPLIIVDVKSAINIENGFIPIDYRGCQVYLKHPK